MKRTLLALKTAKTIRLLQIDSSVFSYEPVLTALQQLRPSQLQLEHDLFHWTTGDLLNTPPSLFRTQRLADRIQADRGLDLAREFNLGKRIVLDTSQADSFIAGLTQAVSIIQGPPG